MALDGRQADGYSGSKHHRIVKKGNKRRERRRAKLNPECLDNYKRYRGYEL